MANVLDRYLGYKRPEDDGADVQVPYRSPLTPATKAQQDPSVAADDGDEGDGDASPAPIGDKALQQLAKTRPDLVEAYRAKMKPSQDALADARSAQDIGNYGNVAGKLLNDFGNSQKRDVVLGNRLQDLGKAPTILKADRPDYDPSVINNVTGQGVKRSEEDRNQARQDFGEETSLQDLQDKRSDQDLARGDQAIARDRAKREADPNSEDSRQAREYLKSIVPSAGDIPGFDQMTAQRAREIAPQLMDKYKLDETIAGRHEDAQIRKDALTQGRADKADQKRTQDQDRALGRVSQQLESARGNPAVAQAEKDIYAAQKANSLADLYGDPNKLSMPQVRLLASEIGKIASGGAPSMHELDGLTPNTLTGKLSEVTSRFTNKPTPANAAAFVKQYKDYAAQLSKDAQGVIQDKYGRVIESNKGKLSDDDYQGLQNNYINRFKPAESSAPKVMHGSDLP